MNTESHITPEELAEIVSMHLGKHLHTKDDFYEVGGHSMLIVKIMHQLRQSGWRLDPRAFARDARLDQLAKSTTRI